MDTSFLWYALSSGALTLLGFLLVTNIPGVNRQANRWLGLFFFCLATLFAQLFIEAVTPADRITLFWLMPLLELPRWATFPCFFLAVTCFVNPTAPLRTAVWHFIPFFLFCLFAAFVLFPSTYTGSQIPFYLPPPVVWVIRNLFLGQAIFYWCLSFILLRRHQHQIRRFSAAVERIDLAWITFILFAVLAMTALWLLGKNYPPIAAITPIGYFVLTVFMAYHSLNQVVIYPVQEDQLAEVIEAITTPTQQYARLTDDQVQLLQNKVHQLVVDKELFLDPLLNLPVLAEKVGIGTHELSFVLNQGFGKNFYQYINELRVAEAKRLLVHPDFRHKDITGIAIHAGFNSRTTFYTAFKKITGMTPKAYLSRQDA
ncbi:MAG TPA: helix-turn-helix domain-containing protein [Parapedobacter sp.]|nr:helix-turn-helix domain-containing protein [Parapedobacter sp.]